MKEKGITLIALVVTIVVIIILAAVSISMLLGDNGIIKQAEYSKEQTEIANEKEKVELAAIAARQKTNWGEITEDNLVIELDKNIGNGNYTLTQKNNNFLVTYNDSKRTYEVDTNGNVKIVETINDEDNPIINSMINNNYFGINSNGQNPEETTEGINKAIEYASDNGIQDIKLEKGIYTVIGYKEGEKFGGIIFKSNIHLDLNGSTIIQYVNDKPRYSNFIMKNVQNVKLFNGILIGERQEHNYDGIVSEYEETHEWGHGINIWGSKNVEISNLEIYDMIGDGVYISGTSINNTSTSIFIHDCNIYNTRRQGISIISAENVEIYNNEIHDINGTDPASGIDLESNEETERIDNIKIYKNNLYNFSQNNLAIVLVRYIYNVEIYENTITNGKIQANDTREMLEIRKNEIINGNIELLSSDNNINLGYYLQDLKVNDNIIQNGSIFIQGANKFYVSNNSVTDGSIGMADCSGELYNNNIINSTTEERPYAYILDSIRQSGTYTVKQYNNLYEGLFTENYSIDYGYYTVENVQP